MVSHIPVMSHTPVNYVSSLAEFYSMVDSSTTFRGISTQIAGGCWAHRQLHAGIRYIPVPSKLRISLVSVEGSHSSLAEFYSMVDSSTTVWGIPIRIVGGCWARRQLHAGIWYVPVTSKLRISLAPVEGRLRQYPGGISLNGWLLHNRYRYSNSDWGRLLGSMTASRRYKVRPCRIKTQDFAGLCGWET